MDWNAICGGFAAGDLADRVYEGLAVVRTSAAYEGSVNVEED